MSIAADHNLPLLLFLGLILLLWLGSESFGGLPKRCTCGGVVEEVLVVGFLGGTISKVAPSVSKGLGSEGAIERGARALRDVLKEERGHDSPKEHLLPVGMNLEVRVNAAGVDREAKHLLLAKSVVELLGEEDVGHFGVSIRNLEEEEV